MFYLENPKENTHTPPRANQEVQHAGRRECNTQRLISCTWAVKTSNTGIKQITLLKLAWKNEILRNKFNKWSLKLVHQKLKLLKEIEEKTQKHKKRPPQIERPPVFW